MNDGTDAASGAAPNTSGVSRTVTIVNKRGLHARAAAKFVQQAAQFDARITVAKDGTVVSGCSIMGLMMLAAAPGCDIELRATGFEADAAVAALSALIGAKFDED